MDSKLQQIAIAKFCGWTQVRQEVGNYRNPSGQPGFVVLPNYLNDLNAMHKAVDCLTDKLQATYAKHLRVICGNDGVLKYVHATAAQCAEAFLRTIEKWENE